jgi:hypothetical protein
VSKDVFSPTLDGLGRRFPRLLIAANVVLLLFITFILLTATEAPVVLYQAF